MKVVDFSILFDQANGTYLPGQMLTGKVRIILNAPKVFKRLKIKFEGRAYVEWSDLERDDDGSRENHFERKRVTYRSKENHFKRKLILDEREEMDFTLSAGEHFYKFSVPIPENIPSSFKGSHGDISYFATAKLEIPRQLNKIKKENFTVKNYFNLNDFPDLKAPSEIEKSKIFHSLCCIPVGKLTIRACIPRSGFTSDESIPLTLKINNESCVALSQITAYLVREIEWHAGSKTKRSSKKLKSFSLGSANDNCSMNLVERVPIPNDGFPYLENCHSILLKHFLHIEAVPDGPHFDLNIFLPITFGDIPFKPEDELPPDYDEAVNNHERF